MKLSEAIMMNGMTKPQGYGPDSVKSLDAPCVLGGALQVIGRQDTRNEEVNYSEITRCWPWADRIEVCPQCLIEHGSNNSRRVWSILWHLNDTHLWTRAQIAEWVATVEPKEEKQSTEVKQEEVHA